MGINNLVSMNIRYFRKLKGLTQETLAEKVNVSPVYISYLERGSKVPSLSLLGKIADTLEVDPALFFIRTDDFASSETNKLLSKVCSLGKPSIIFINEIITAYIKMKNSAVGNHH